MVVYYINKKSESLTDYPYPIKEGDICMLYDGEVIKTIYIDSETDEDSIWRDFKFVDVKSFKSYRFPILDSVLCAPIGNFRAIGDAVLLTQLIQECKGEWLLDFLNETSSILSGYVDYWDIEILRRLTGDDNIKVVFEEEEVLSGLTAMPQKNEELEDDVDRVNVNDEDYLPENEDIRWFCISALSCIEGEMNNRDYKILNDVLNGVSRKAIASKFGLTQERIRQISVKTTRQAREIIITQRNSLEKFKDENAKLNVQINLLKEEIVQLKKLLPLDVYFQEKYGDDLNTDIYNLLETPIEDIKLSVRAIKALQVLGAQKFSDIPQNSYASVMKVRNSGRKTVSEITWMLDDFEMSLGMTINEIVQVLEKNDWQIAKRMWIKERGKRYEIIENPPKIVEENPEELKVVLTKDKIEAARTPNGGFTRSQLEAIGVPWPPPKDWYELVVGKLITPKQLEAFNHIEYIVKPTYKTSQKNLKTYKDVASNSVEEMKMEAILQAMTHFVQPATPRDIARTINRSTWGDENVREDTVDSFLKRLPEVEYIQWGKYILKSKIESTKG